MTSAPWSVAQRTASAISVSESTPPPKAIEIESREASGADADDTGARSGAAPGGERGDHRAVLATVGADRGLAVRGALAGDIRAVDDRAAQLAHAAVDAGVDDGDRDAGAPRDGPRVLDAVVVEPVLAVAHGVRVAGSARRGGRARRSGGRSPASRSEREAGERPRRLTPTLPPSRHPVPRTRSAPATSSSARAPRRRSGSLPVRRRARARRARAGT